MKVVRRSALAALLLLVATTATTYAQYPKATGYVNDFAQLLSREQGTSLNNELIAFEKKTTIEIVVVTVPWLNNQSIEDYTLGLAKEWGVGKRDQNNGIVFLIAPKERKMRIQTASGVRSVLTDSRADQIRDTAVLPRFKAGKMAQGIIDGTHAIMLTIDESFSPVATSASQSTSKEWTAENTEILIYVLSGMVGAVLLLFLIVPPIRRSQARKYVFKHRKVVAAQFVEVEKTIRIDVKKETRTKLAKLKGKFSSIDRLVDTSEGVNWIEVRKELDSMGYFLNEIVWDIKQDIAFAEKARKEGPELMKKIPGIIEAAEKKLAEGKQSPKATKCLEEARSQYAQAQSQHSGMTTMDWVILYVILNNALSSAENAESAHEYANSDHSSSSSSSSDYGFGGSSGLGGGGGFDSGGGGSTGSW